MGYPSVKGRLHTRYSPVRVIVGRKDGPPPFLPLSLALFEDGGNTHAAADAQGGQALLGIGPFGHLMEQGLSLLHI